MSDTFDSDDGRTRSFPSDAELLADAAKLLEEWDSRFPTQYEGDDTLTPRTASWLTAFAALKGGGSR